jgi:hypothetical protein
MYIPGHICRQLYELHPQLRIGWFGRKRRYTGELNPGSFAVIQLYHIQDAGRPDEEHTYFTFWNPPGHYFGPIYNKDGGSRPDWDPVTRVPVCVANLEDFDIPLEDVLSGKFLLEVKEWMTPIRTRTVRSIKRRVKDLNDELEDIGGEAAEYLWRQAQRSDAETVVMADKHCRRDMERFEARKDWTNRMLGSYYDVAGM